MEKKKEETSEFNPDLAIVLDHSGNGAKDFVLFTENGPSVSVWQNIIGVGPVYICDIEPNGNKLQQCDCIYNHNHQVEIKISLSNNNYIYVYYYINSMHTIVGDIEPLYLHGDCCEFGPYSYYILNVDEKVLSVYGRSTTLNFDKIDVQGLYNVKTSSIKEVSCPGNVINRTDTAFFFMTDDYKFYVIRGELYNSGQSIADDKLHCDYILNQEFMRKTYKEDGTIDWFLFPMEILPFPTSGPKLTGLIDASGTLKRVPEIVYGKLIHNEIKSLSFYGGNESASSEILDSDYMFTPLASCTLIDMSHGEGPTSLKITTLQGGVKIFEAGLYIRSEIPADKLSKIIDKLDDNRRKIEENQ